MPSPTPRKRPARRGAYAEPGSVRPETSAAAYSWPCPRCPCKTNLRGLFREICSHCTHIHRDPTIQKEDAEDASPPTDVS
jgi:hypothetical protein